MEKQRKIVLVAILEKTLSSQIPVKQQLREIATQAAEKLDTSNVKVIQV